MQWFNDSTISYRLYDDLMIQWFKWFTNVCLVDQRTTNCSHQQMDGQMKLIELMSDMIRYIVYDMWIGIWIEEYEYANGASLVIIYKSWKNHESATANRLMSDIQTGRVRYVGRFDINLYRCIQHRSTHQPNNTINWWCMTKDEQGLLCHLPQSRYDRHSDEGLLKAHNRMLIPALYKFQVILNKSWNIISCDRICIGHAIRSLHRSGSYSDKPHLRVLCIICFLSRDPTWWKTQKEPPEREGQIAHCCIHIITILRYWTHKECEPHITSKSNLHCYIHMSALTECSWFYIVTWNWISMPQFPDSLNFSSTYK